MPYTCFSYSVDAPSMPGEHPFIAYPVAPCFSYADTVRPSRTGGACFSYGGTTTHCFSDADTARPSRVTTHCLSYTDTGSACFSDAETARPSRTGSTCFSY